MRLLTVLLFALVLAVPVMAETSQRLLIDPDVAGYPLVTEDWSEYFANVEGLYGVSAVITQNGADTVEVFCDLADGAETYTRTRVYFVDTDGTSGLLKLLVSTDATRDSLGTGLTEFKLNEFNAGTISSAFYTGVTGTNGTVIYEVSIPQSTWFELPDFGFNADYRIGLVCADTTTINIEHFWTEVE